ncbi:MAG: DUF5667 domain-containing protein [Candidatus Pacebacteria bacterium]|nr:DUF5667 domain-containing protein [Candidatus Paceibacterota bacterium]
MKKTLLLIAVLSFLVVGAGIINAAETAATSTAELPSVSLTPDSPFYFVKSIRESIQTFFTFGAENKAKQYLHLSEVRLAEYEKMLEKGKAEIAQKTLDKYKKQLDRALEKSKELSEAEAMGKVSGEILKHREILEGVLEKAPETAKPDIEKIIEKAREAAVKMVEEGWKDAPAEVQKCVKTLVSEVTEKFTTKDIQTTLLNCLKPGAKMPTETITIDALKKIRDFYGNSLPAKDLESLNEVIENKSGIIPQGTGIPSGVPNLNLEEINKVQEEAYKNLTPEQLEYIKKAQEESANSPQPYIPSSGSGMGL